MGVPERWQLRTQIQKSECQVSNPQHCPLTLSSSFSGPVFSCLNKGDENSAQGTCQLWELLNVYSVSTKVLRTQPLTTTLQLCELGKTGIYQSTWYTYTWSLWNSTKSFLFSKQYFFGGKCLRKQYKIGQGLKCHSPRAAEKAFESLSLIPVLFNSTFSSFYTSS